MVMKQFRRYATKKRGELTICELSQESTPKSKQTQTL